MLNQDERDVERDNIDPASDKTVHSTPSQRRTEIIDALFANRVVRIEQIAQQLGVSTATVYRDVQALEDAGIVERSKGFLRALAPSTAELPPNIRKKRQLAEKTRLAETAFGLLAPGDVVLLDDSSTTAPLLPLLDDIRSLTVITNSLPVARHLENSRSHELVLIGGRYQRWAGAFYGTLANSMVSELHADVCIMSDAAVWGDATYNPNDYVIDMKREMLRASDERVLLVDHTKFARSAWQKTAPLSTFTRIIATEECSEDDIARLKEQCSDVQIV